MTAARRDNSAASQRSRLFGYLKEVGPITTLGARSKLDICHPAARCQELRQRGWPIETVWVTDINPEGHEHRVAKYTLLPRKQLPLDDFLQGEEARKAGDVKTATPGVVAATAGSIEKRKDHSKDSVSACEFQAGIPQGGEEI